MDTAPTPFEALKKAVAAAGSQSELARICGISQPAVWRWVQSSKRVPADYVLRIEAKTGVSRHHLRPDIYPSTLPAELETPIVAGADDAVACDQQSVLQAKDAA
jgi:DNA-binding transcriptional regulator YdaS (Cro superfamily)